MEISRITPRSITIIVPFPSGLIRCDHALAASRRVDNLIKAQSQCELTVVAYLSDEVLPILLDDTDAGRVEASAEHPNSYPVRTAMIRAANVDMSSISRWR